MSYMFNECKNVISLDLSSFDTKNVNNMSYMFYNCFNLIDLKISFSFQLNTGKIDQNSKNNNISIFLL